MEYDKPSLETLKQWLADFVSTRRTQMGISQKRLAELAGTTEQYISGIESAKRNPLTCPPILVPVSELVEI